MLTGDITNKIIDYETGVLRDDQIIALFQELIDTGLAWELQGHYGRIAIAMIQGGHCHRPEAEDNSFTDPTEHFPEDEDGDMYDVTPEVR